jgi:putative PIN family toxin of toxin-antitoxin system
VLKVVVDANIWISALLNSNNALEVVHLLEKDQYRLICAEALISELAEVLERPKFQARIQPGRKDSLVDLVREKAQFVELPASVQNVCRDPKDEVYIVCAVVAQADFLVSGDKDLLDLNEHEGVKIISLQSFVQLFQ